jgi:4-hydroxyacetophenone monooxygenase
MPILPPVEPITEDDATIRAHLDHATVGALLPAVAQITGDLGLLRPDLRPNPDDLLDPQGGLTPAQVTEARDLAAAALVRYRDEGSIAVPHPDDTTLRRLMAFVVGDANCDDHFELLREELGVAGEDWRAPGWHKDDVAPDTPFTVGIIGAGMSGIAAGHRLGQAGIDYVVFEKNPDVGGTWFENTYPGCRVDVPNHLYSYSFAQTDWGQHYSSQDVLLDYFRRCADELGVRDHVRFGTEVTSCEWDDDASVWRVHLRDDQGATGTVEVQALVSAVGQLNRPSFPDIEGRDEFAGVAFHSAEWRHDVDLTGRRVAVIGTGASAAQFIPRVADEAADLTVFQRTPAWMVPSPEYYDDVPEPVRWLFRHVPNYAQWYRLWLFWRSHEGLRPAAEVDPEWRSETGSVSAQNEMVRLLLAQYLEAEFADRPDLLEQVMPHYPPMAKRVIRDNGIWARTLTRDSVHLVTEPIARIVPEGVETADGVVHEADVLVYGTGFQASRFLTPMRVTGRGGIDLHETWCGDARAYLGITVPGFPNLFLMYGPNTNIVINGSIIFFSECEARYIVEAVRLLLETGHHALDVREDVHDDFNEAVDASNRRMAWGASSVNSWYKNATGRVAQNWPFSLLEYWRRTRRPDPADYELT